MSNGFEIIFVKQSYGLMKHPAIERLQRNQTFYPELKQFLDDLMDDYGLQEPSIDIPTPIEYPRDKL